MEVGSDHESRFRPQSSVWVTLLLRIDTLIPLGPKVDEDNGRDYLLTF